MSERKNQSSQDETWIDDEETTSQWPPVYRDGKVHVVKDKCSTCVFRPANVMHLNPGRLKGMVEDSLRQDTGFACHQTLSYGGQTDHYEGEALCGGFVEKYGDQIVPVRMARALDCLEEVEPAPAEDRPGSPD